MLLVLLVGRLPVGKLTVASSTGAGAAPARGWWVAWVQWGSRRRRHFHSADGRGHGSAADRGADAAELPVAAESGGGNFLAFGRLRAEIVRPRQRPGGN